MNEVFLIFQFLVLFRQKFSITISDSLKENSILHLLLFFFYFKHEFFIRKILILWKMNSSARMKFSLFFSFFCSWDTNSRSQFLTAWKRIQFCISSFLLLLWWCIFFKKNFNFLKAEFVCTNEIFLIFHFLVPLRHKFWIWIYDSLKENSALHLLLFFFYSQQEFLKRKILILSKLNSSSWMKFLLFLNF